MKGPANGEAELIRDIRVVPYTIQGETRGDVTADLTAGLEADLTGRSIADALAMPGLSDIDLDVELPPRR